MEGAYSSTLVECFIDSVSFAFPLKSTLLKRAAFPPRLGATGEEKMVLFSRLT
jgi:hypothetical protein